MVTLMRSQHSPCITSVSSLKCLSCFSVFPWLLPHVGGVGLAKWHLATFFPSLQSNWRNKLVFNKGLRTRQRHCADKMPLLMYLHALCFYGTFVRVLHWYHILHTALLTSHSLSMLRHTRKPRTTRPFTSQF